MSKRINLHISKDYILDEDGKHIYNDINNYEELCYELLNAGDYDLNTYYNELFEVYYELIIEEDILNEILNSYNIKFE